MVKTRSPSCTGAWLRWNGPAPPAWRCGSALCWPEQGHILLRIGAIAERRFCARGQIAQPDIALRYTCWLVRIKPFPSTEEARAVAGFGDHGYTRVLQSLETVRSGRRSMRPRSASWLRRHFPLPGILVGQIGQFSRRCEASRAATRNSACRRSRQAWPWYRVCPGGEWFRRRRRVPFLGRGGRGAFQCHVEEGHGFLVSSESTRIT